MDFDIERFERDVSKHTIRIILDQGVYRHIRFKTPGTTNMYFDIVTWPGHLCYTGDMGSYVFRRLLDMLEFFRRVGEKKYQISFGYWASKVEASDKHCGIKEWSPEKFRANVKEYFDDYVAEIDDEDGTSESREEKLKELWSEIEDAVLRHAHEEVNAMDAVYDFRYEGFSFQDWERSSKVWAYRFLWCCHALVWAIELYDKTKTQSGETK